MERLTMRKIREVLRLKWEVGLSNRQIAASCRVTHGTVAAYLRRAGQAGLSWPLSADLTDGELEQRLFQQAMGEAGVERSLPDWSQVHQELKRKGVTLFLLWEEYKACHPQGYQYSQFCDRYRRWKDGLEVCMRQDHKAGEKLFVDYCGQTASVIDPHSGEIREAQIFVAALGASNYTYAEATWTQQLPDWIASHMRAWNYLGGVTELVVPDNLGSGVSRACRYDPDVNPTYQDLARHYGTAIMPARVRKPRDKAKVENAVQGVEQQILAALRHRTFFSLAELNQAIGELLGAYNERPFQELPGSRRTLFEQVDRPALKPLPQRPYEFAQWKKVRVHLDYHVEVEGHYYSVPYSLVRQEVEVRLTAQVVECFHRGQRVASHIRSFQKGRHTTVKEHMPRAHQEYADCTPERLVRWAQQSGAATAAVVELLMSSRPHIQQGYRACLGLMRLGKQYGAERLEAACLRARFIESPGYRSIASILKQGLDQLPLPGSPQEQPPIEHAHVRGSQYYQSDCDLQERRNPDVDSSDPGQTSEFEVDRDVQSLAGSAAIAGVWQSQF